MHPEIWFWLRKQKIKNGLIPIYFRIKLNGTNTNNGHSTKIYIKEVEWNQANQVVNPTCKSHRIYNAILEKLRNDIYKFWLSLDVSRLGITAIYFYKEFTESNKPKAVKTILSVFKEYLEIQGKKLKAKEITKATLIAWQRKETNLIKWLNYLGKSDLSLKEVKPTHFESIKLFYKVNLGFDNNYAMKQIAGIKSVLKYAVQNRDTTINPFEGQTIKKVVKPIRYLTNQELDKIIKTDLKLSTLDKVRDFFIFQCFTGLDFIDVIELKESHLITDSSGIWIKKIRHKTSNLSEPMQACVPLWLFPYPLQIIEKYQGIENLPKMTNQRLNFYLKMISLVCEIDKPISTKYSRRTFGMKMRNELGFSREAVAVMLGDKDLRIVETHYAKANELRVLTELKNLSIKNQEV